MRWMMPPNNDELAREYEQLVAVSTDLPVPDWALQRACCCSAPPHFKVIFPVEGPASGVVDMLFCNHHMAEARQALEARGGRVIAEYHRADD